MSTTRAVFHAPMSALNADADWNACGPTTRGVRRWKRTHMRACARHLGSAAAHTPGRQRKPTERDKGCIYRTTLSRTPCSRCHIYLPLYIVISTSKYLYIHLNLQLYPCVCVCVCVRVFVCACVCVCVCACLCACVCSHFIWYIGDVYMYIIRPKQR
jgi:hypothetical protein